MLAYAAVARNGFYDNETQKTEVTIRTHSFSLVSLVATSELFLNPISKPLTEEY